MPQRILALEITDSDLKATVLETTFRDYRVAGFYRQPLSASDGTIEEQVRRFIEQHALPGNTVLSALPGDRVTWRTLFLPFRDRKRLAQTIPFELESQVPFGLDEVVIDYQVLHRDRSGTTVLAALVPKGDLERHLEVLKTAGIDPKVVDVGPLAMLNTLRLVPGLPPTFVFIDFAPARTTIALQRNGELEGLRTLTAPAPPAADGGNGAGMAGDGDSPPGISWLMGEIRWTLLALNGAPLEDGLPCYVAGELANGDAVHRELATTLRLDVRALDQIPLRGLEAEAGAQAPAFTSSLGLALREAVPAAALGLNFRRGEFTYHRSQQELHRSLRAVAALAALVVALTVVDVYMGYRQLAIRAADVEAQIRQVFAATLPDVQRMSEPRAQLQTEIDALGQRLSFLNGVIPVSGSTSVDVLRAISGAVPTKIRIDTDEYLMDPDAVRVRGNTDTFESVDAIKQQLLATGFFSDVQVKDVKAAKDGTSVDFRLTLLPFKDFRLRERQP